MFKSQEELDKYINDIFIKQRIDSSMFEISSISNAIGGKEQRLINRTPVKNVNCTYVIKYYKKLKLFVVWNYKSNHSMSYSFKTIKDKLNKGINYADKGSNFHTINQCKIYFEYEENFEKLIYQINGGL